ncbi:ParA family protein [Paenibacillus cremeus]|uniref:ParA family protein n=1 Tax=Paenibacillus cremeus TaxID=2163881 RepID=A0A559K433_9BACL|nr:ParA family protein [Paenibacillus cremeus]TVY06905.1 ParA family protein [Paenibacillus cremeus]
MTGQVINVLSIKGGVGKSTIVKLLSLVADALGLKVCIIDMCENSSIATGFFRDRDSFDKSAYDWFIGDAKPSEVIQQFEDSNIYYIPSDERICSFSDWVNKNIPKVRQLQTLCSKIEPLKKLFDIIVIDSHPTATTDLVHYAIAASDYCVIPCEVDKDAVNGAYRCCQIITDYQLAGFSIDYGIVFNKVDLGVKANAQLQQMKQSFINLGVPETKFLGNVRYSKTVTTTKNDGVMLNRTHNKYAENVMNDMRAVSDRITFALKQNEVEA